MSAIESYLDELFLATRTLPARQARYLLAETEAHLRDAAEAAVASGLSEPAAEQAALTDFGSVADLVGRERNRLRTPLRVVAGQVARTGFVLGSIGAIAVGLSGAVAALVYWIGGAGAIAPAPHAGDLTAANRSRWIGLAPGSSCRAAAISDWANETVSYRIALGVLGAIALAIYFVLSRRLGSRPGLAPVVTESIATTLFVFAAVATLGLGIDSIVINSGSGAGQWLSATPVAVAAAAVFGTRLVRRLREPAVAL